MERDFAAYLFTLLRPLFTSGALFLIAHEYSVRKVNSMFKWRLDANIQQQDAQHQGHVLDLQTSVSKVRQSGDRSPHIVKGQSHLYTKP